jgi:erythromycin esterase-like protein
MTMRTRRNLNNAFQLGRQMSYGEIAYEKILSLSQVFTNAPCLLTVEECKAALIAAERVNLDHVEQLIHRADMWTAATAAVSPFYAELRSLIRANQPAKTLDMIDALGAKLTAMRTAARELRREWSAREAAWSRRRSRVASE